MSSQECLFLTKLRYRMQLRKTIFSRSQIKNSNGEYIYELENAYELASKEIIILIA